MIILNYTQLSTDKQQRTREFFSAHKGILMNKTDQEIEALMTMTDLSHGELMFTAWRGETLLATLGVVTTAVARKGEAYLTAFSTADNSESREGFMALLGHIQTEVLEPIKDNKPVLLKLGIGPKLDFMVEPAKALGFELQSTMLHMSRSNDLPVCEGLHMEPLTAEWLSAYKAIQNETFAEVPNGAMESEETLSEWLEAAEDDAWRGLLFEPLPDRSTEVGISESADKGWTKPVGFYELSLSTEADVKIGWIDAVGVSNAFRGKGLGKKALHSLCAFLKDQGADRVELLVMDANQTAAQLYQREGFVLLGIYNQWLGKQI